MSNIVTPVFLDANGKIRSIWWVVIFFLFLSLLLFPMIFLSSYYEFEITFWQQALLIVIVSILCQALRRRPLTQLFGSININWLKELSFGLSVGAVLMVVPAMLLTSLGIVRWQVNDVSFLVFLPGVSMMLSVAIAEELLFRGFVFQRLIESFGTWPAQILIAGLFLLTHLNNPGMTGSTKVLASVNIFIASICFGVAYIKTKKLGMPIGIHFMANVTQGTFLGFGVSGEKEVSLLTPILTDIPDWITGGVFGLEASIVGLITLILLTASLYFWYPSESPNYN